MFAMDLNSAANRAWAPSMKEQPTRSGNIGSSVRVYPPETSVVSTVSRFVVEKSPATGQHALSVHPGLGKAAMNEEER
jgi:hypothetical protein